HFIWIIWFIGMFNNKQNRQIFEKYSIIIETIPLQSIEEIQQLLRVIYKFNNFLFFNNVNFFSFKGIESNEKQVMKTGITNLLENHKNPLVWINFSQQLEVFNIAPPK